MKIGTKVAVCHDGKWGRRVEGEVIATRRGHHIKVRFVYDDEEGGAVEFWARRRPAIRYQRRKRGSCIIYGKRKASFAGWASDLQIFCPWFTVRPWKPLEKEYED